MNEAAAHTAGRILRGHAGLRAELTSTGAIRRFDCGGIALALFVGNEIEGSAGNVYLRLHGATVESTPLLGPSGPTLGTNGGLALFAVR